jgi:ABC-type lipoprotein export system ATPase subunit
MMPLLVGRAPRREAEARALLLLRELGLEERVHHRPGMLSGGEQQRVAVARALAPAPRAVLADEPTGNLDADTAAGVLDLLDTLARETGRTVLMATHSREVMGVADRVLTIQRGTLTERPGC